MAFGIGKQIEVASSKWLRFLHGLQGEVDRSHTVLTTAPFRRSAILCLVFDPSTTFIIQRDAQTRPDGLGTHSAEPRFYTVSLALAGKTLAAPEVLWHLPSISLAVEIELPENLASLKLPAGVDRRLRELLDKQDAGLPLSEDEQSEAEGLVDLSEILSLLRLRSKRIS